MDNQTSLIDCVYCCTVYPSRLHIILLQRTCVVFWPLLKATLCKFISRGVIELFKIIKGMYDSTCVPHLDLMKLSDDLIRTRANQYKLIQHHCHYDLRKFNFTNRVIPIWNSLSNHVVSADTVNILKIV